MNYIPLNVKTHYELLSSLIKIDDLVSFCRDNNVKTIGITDTNMFSAMEFINSCNKNGIKPIIGVSFQIEKYNMILYAKSYKGYVNLLNLVSIRNTSSLSKNAFLDHKDELICVTSDYNNYLEYKELYIDVYLSYTNISERNNALLVTDKIVFMKEALYFNDSDKDYLKYLNLIRDGKTIDNFEDYSYDNSLNFDIDEFDAQTTIHFASLCNLILPDYNFKLPEYSPNKVELLSNLCNKGLNKRLNGNVPLSYLDRLNMELKVINDMNFTDYFLIVYDFVLYAKKSGIVIGPGRGSAAGSLVSYSLGITEIDPLKYDLIFERFLNKDRITLPDIDVDIEYLRRNEVVNYVKNKYGYDKVANIVTFGTLLPKQVIRDVGRILKISNSKIDHLIKMINDKETFKELDGSHDFLELINNDDELKKVVRICKKLEGLKRHTSIHAAGVVISDEPLMNKVPLYKSSDNLLTGFTMEYLESIGLLKIDFLAIKNLTTIDSIIKLVKNNYGIDININKIPLNDSKTLNLFYNANTLGIFQFESEGMMKFLKSLKVKNFDDLVNAIALYRPGPKDNISLFIDVRERRKKANYIVPELESILGNTNGIIIYQEQILDILKKIGGFSYSEADIIRRAMSKKKEDVIEKYRKDFILGSFANGVDKEKANLIYDLILKFANYGFNKSHSVAYSFVAYQMAFLKSYFPALFMICLLNDCIGNVGKTKDYVNETHKIGASFIRPNVIYSTNKYELIDNKILYPLNIIKNVGKEAVMSILEARELNDFTDYISFVKNVYSSKVNIGIIENLIYSGCLDCFNLNRKTMIDNLQNVIEYSSLCKELGEKNVLKPEIILAKEFDQTTIMNKEHELFGFYIDNHPTSKLRNEKMIYLDELPKYFDRIVASIGLIENIKEIKTKNNEIMAFISISDEKTNTILVAFPKVYDKVMLKIGDVIIFNGRVEKRLSEYQIIAYKIDIKNN